MQPGEVTQAWGEWIASMGEWHVFGALTYDPARRRSDRDGPIAPGVDVVRSHARAWLRDTRVEAAVLALEYHKNGWPHLHPLVRLAGGVQRGDLVRLGQAWFARHGYAKLELPRDRDDVCAYASKYLAKDLHRGDVFLWPKTGSMSSHQLGLARA
jgi:hypothetical protein